MMLVFMLPDFNRAVFCDQNTQRLRDWRDRARSSSKQQHGVVTKDLQLRVAIVDDVMVLEMEELVKVL